MSEERGGSLKRFFKEVASMTLWEAVRYLAGLVVAAGLLFLGSRSLSAFLARVWLFLAPYRGVLTLVFVSGGVWLCLFLRERLSAFRARFYVDSDFRVLTKEIVYEYHDMTHLTYRKRVVLQALKQGLDAYRDKYHWTGRGPVLMRCAIQEQELQQTYRKSVWQFYEIRFQRTLKKGETVETEVIWNLEDPERAAVPFFSATIDEPTNKLIMKLSLPPTLGVREATGEESSGIAIKKALGSRIIPLDRNGSLTWEIRNPRLLYHYEIKWKFPTHRT